MLSPGSARLLGELRRAQVGTALIGALLCALAWGWLHGLGFAYGAGVVVVGTWLAASRSFGAPEGPSGSLARIWRGLALKWVFLAGVLFLGIAVLPLPPLPLIAGLAAAQLSFLALAFFRLKAG